ncbi:hypothetical protein GW766_01315 [Candidatus Parcubacteria bacterium]|nr:hypothetical protein [Candidatus Parcubacteria bacterium]
MPTPTTYSGLVNGIIGIINLIIPAIFGIVFVYFVWKVIDAWVINAGDEKRRAEGKQYAMIAVIVFVLMVSAWGIVAMVKSSVFGV